jgi:hypothetical protein
MNDFDYIVTLVICIILYFTRLSNVPMTHYVWFNNAPLKIRNSKLYITWFIVLFLCVSALYICIVNINDISDESDDSRYSIWVITLLIVLKIYYIKMFEVLVGYLEKKMDEKQRITTILAKENIQSFYENKLIRPFFYAYGIILIVICMSNVTVICVYFVNSKSFIAILSLISISTILCIFAIIYMFILIKPTVVRDIMSKKNSKTAKQ